MVAQRLPPFPGDADAEDFVRVDWNNKLQVKTNSPSSVTWSNIDFSGSSLSNIVSRNHGLLTAILGTGAYHISASEAGRVTATMTIQSKASDPTTSDIPAGNWAIYKNTGSGAVKLWANDSGTMKSVALT